MYLEPTCNNHEKFNAIFPFSNFYHNDIHIICHCVEERLSGKLLKIFQIKNILFYRFGIENVIHKFHESKCNK